MQPPLAIFEPTEEGMSSVSPTLGDGMSRVSSTLGDGATIVSATAGPRSPGFRSRVGAERRRVHSGRGGRRVDRDRLRLRSRRAGSRSCRPLVGRALRSSGGSAPALSSRPRRPRRGTINISDPRESCPGNDRSIIRVSDSTGARPPTSPPSGLHRPWHRPRQSDEDQGQEARRAGSRDAARHQGTPDLSARSSPGRS